MTAQKGKDLLLKMVPPGQTQPVTVAGMRSRRLAFNAESVDVTDFESAGRWRELLGGAGVQRAAISGSGIFKDAQADGYIRDAFFSSSIADWSVIVPDFGTVSGPFQIVGLEYAGEHNGEVVFELALESAGALSFAAAA
ncbi:MAG: phage major tail protein, TP901-1 family [Pseudomonadota bacterium]